MMKKFTENKIFISGISGSGKSTFAEEYSKKYNITYFNFDDNWTYYADNQYEQIVEKYPEQFVTDAIPYTRDENNKYKFLDYYEKNKNDIKIICICCTDINEFNNRIKDKFYTNTEEAYNSFYYYYFFEINDFSNLNIEYYDSCTDEFITKDELLNRINWFPTFLKKFKLKNHLDSQVYDKYYQDIECLDFIGYSESYKSWDNIKNLIDWKGKKVADLGCFHCFFSIKIAKEGGIVTGFDINDSVLSTSKLINEIEEDIIDIKKWEGGDEIPSEFDVSLCLNVIHHFRDIKKGLQNIKSRLVLFETNSDLIDLISEEYNILETKKSHRKDVNNNDRIILLCEKKYN